MSSFKLTDKTTMDIASKIARVTHELNNLLVNEKLKMKESSEEDGGLVKHSHAVKISKIIDILYMNSSMINLLSSIDKKPEMLSDDAFIYITRKAAAWLYKITCIALDEDFCRLEEEIRYVYKWFMRVTAVVNYDFKF